MYKMGRVEEGARDRVRERRREKKETAGEKKWNDDENALNAKLSFVYVANRQPICMVYIQAQPEPFNIAKYNAFSKYIVINDDNHYEAMQNMK